MPGQLALGRLARHGLRLHPGLDESLRHVVRVLDAGRVDDPGHVLEARLVEVGHRRVEGRLVEQRGQLFLVEVLVHLALAKRHVGDRAHAHAGRDADAAQRRDHAAPGGLGEVEARGLRREQVRDVTRDQRAGRGHPDEHRPEPGADGGAGLLAEGGVGLVADDDRVGVGDLAGVAHEPLVGLDGHGAAGRRLVAVLEQRRRDAVAVAAGAQLAQELVNQVAPVGEDQDAAGARGLHEAQRRHGLAGTGGVLEPEAAGRTRVLDGRVGGRLLLGLLGRIPVERLLVGKLVALDLDLAGGQLRLGDRRAAVGALGHLQLGGERDQRSGEGVDLVGVQDGAVGQVRLLVAQQPLEAEHERIGASPLDRGLCRGRHSARLRRRRARRGARCPVRAPARRPLRAARRPRARIPRRARGHRRRPASPQEQSLSQPRSAYSDGEETNRAGR